MGVHDAAINKAWKAVERYTPADAVWLTVYNSLLTSGQSTYEKMVEDFIRFNFTDTNVRPVCRLYQCVFSRRPDGDGLDYWVAGFKHNLSVLNGDRKLALTALANNWTQSAEYLTRYPATMNDIEFVAALYRNTLKREADPIGHQNWVNQLAAGWTRAQVIVEFSEADEFINLTYANINDMLRKAAMDDPSAYVGTLN